MPTATRCTQRHQAGGQRAASASPANTWSTPTSSRSRWPRAPSPARAASCRATRSTTRSPASATRTPGVALISPPPHHDIYSIEDLAQLIHDLKNANRARAHLGQAGGRGRRRHRRGRRGQGQGRHGADQRPRRRHGRLPAHLIKHAGMPWELGLAETQQTLVLNGLRGRIRVQVDGQLQDRPRRGDRRAAGRRGVRLRHARALVALGCIMMRKCHLNTCPVGIATQDPSCARSSPASRSTWIASCCFLAEELREFMAQLGFRTIDEMVGRVDCSTPSPRSPTGRPAGLDFSASCRPPVPTATPTTALRSASRTTAWKSRWT